MNLSAHVNPKFLWDCYVYYLWLYERDSWVGRTAYSFRVLAFLVAFPLIVLALLDIASYVIARTLGIIDNAKTSDGDKAAVIAPTIMINGTFPSETPSSSPLPLPSPDTLRPQPRDAAELLDTIVERQKYFSSEEDVPRLSGVGVFSPAASQPPSPTCGRTPLPGKDGYEEREPAWEGMVMRKNARR